MYDFYLTQDYFTEFLKKGSSQRGHWPMHGIYVNFHSVKTEIDTCVDQAFELIATVTESMVILCAMTEFHIKCISDLPDFRTVTGKRQFLSLTAQRVVDRIWFNTNVAAIHKENEETSFAYCCWLDLEEDMIACDMG